MFGLLLLLITAVILAVLVLTIVVVFNATHPVRRSGAYAAVRGLPFDPGDLGLKFESWTLDRPGARLPVWEVDLRTNSDSSSADSASLGERSGITAVFLHGWGESRIDMLKHIDFWRGRADWAVFYDLRGHGESSPGPSRLGAGEVDDLIALLEHLGHDNRFLLVGRDLGANIVLSAAAVLDAARDRLAGAIAVRPYSDFHCKLRNRLRAADFPVRPMTNLAMKWLSLTGKRPLIAVENATERLSCPSLVLEQWDEAAVAAFVQRAGENADKRS